MSVRGSIARAVLPEASFRWLVERRDRYRSVRGHIEHYGPAKEIDTTVVALLREASVDELRSPEALEALLPRLGLNDEQLEHFPEALHPSAGRGLLHWQYPVQFSRYLAELSRHSIESYVEIGTRHGGTFVLTVEYLRRFGDVSWALGLDIQPAAGLEAYARETPGIETMTADSRGPKFKAALERHSPVGLVLIDGDHSEEGVRADLDTVRDHARMMAFHDIANELVPGVGAVWRELRDDPAERFRCIEFDAQYHEVVERAGHRLLGIGLAIDREWERGHA